MKLSHLSLAIFSAIALAACGGSSSSSPTDNNPPPPKPQPKPQPKPKPQPGTDKIVDPTQTGVVGDLDLSQESSVGILQYIRGKKSKFDRVDNPTEQTSATSILGVNLNEQNPQLSNIVLARLADSNNNTLIQLAGNMPTYAANIWDPRSLQQQNELNVQLLQPAGALTPAQVGDIKKRRDDLEKYLDLLYNDTAINGITDAQKQKDARRQKAQIAAYVATLKNLVDSLESNSKYGEEVAPLIGVVSVDGSNPLYNWGDNVKTESVDLGEDGVKSSTGTYPKANGLVALSYQEIGQNGKEELVSAQGTEKKSQSSTRIFGRNFNTYDAVTMGETTYKNTIMNSYLGGGAYIYPDSGKGFEDKNNFGGFDISSGSKGGKTDVENALTPFDTWQNDTYKDAYKSYANAKRQVGYTLGVVPMSLSKVQYGRVTADLDPPSLTKVTAPVVYQRQNFRIKSDPRGVDTYFYRGVDATTLTQMDALKDTKLTYKGHALMYGVENRFIGKLGANVPNAVGNGGRHGIGNFVSANVDLGDKTIVGGIYNVWQQGPNDADLTEDVIVKFSGKIYGNTALGEAYRVYKEENKGDFRASFFGPNAEELGGSINSTTYQDVYGPKDGKDIWGGVFGAKSVTSGGLSNQWLGDIPKIK